MLPLQQPLSAPEALKLALKAQSTPRNYVFESMCYLQPPDPPPPTPLPAASPPTTPLPVPPVNGSQSPTPTSEFLTSSSSRTPEWIRKRAKHLPKTEPSAFHRGLEKLEKAAPAMTRLDRVLMWREKQRDEPTTDANENNIPPPEGQQRVVGQRRKPPAGESMILIRCDYDKAQNCDAGVFKRPRRPCSEQKTEQDSASESPTSVQEEIYAYLGIDMKPHERVERPDVTDLDIFKRRSLRVRYLNIAKRQEDAQKAAPGVSLAADEKAKPTCTIQIARSYLAEDSGPKLNGWYKDDEERKSFSTASTPEKADQNKEAQDRRKAMREKAKKQRDSSAVVQELINRRVRYMIRSRINFRNTQLRSGRVKKEYRSQTKYSSFFKIRKKPKKAVEPRPASPTPTVSTTSKEIPPPPPPLPASLPVPPPTPDSTVVDRRSIESQPIVSSSSFCTLKNPLDPAEGDATYAFYQSDVLVVVQERLVSFWKYSPLTHLFGVEQEWKLVAKHRRHVVDTELSVACPERLCSWNGTPVFVDFRARNLQQSLRKCPLASVYAALYAFDRRDGKPLHRLAHIETMQSELDEIRFVTWRDSLSFVCAWYEHQMLSNRSRCVKYTLQPDLSMLETKLEFAAVEHKILDLKISKRDELIAFGGTHLSIFNTTSGQLIQSVDLKMPIERILTAFERKDEDRSFLFLIQLLKCNEKQTLQTVAVNMDDSVSWRIIRSVETADLETSPSFTSTLTTDLLLIGFRGGHSMLMTSLWDPHLLRTMQRSTESGDARVFFGANGRVIEIGEKLLVRSVNEFLIGNLKAEKGLNG